MSNSKHRNFRERIFKQWNKTYFKTTLLNKELMKRKKFWKLTTNEYIHDIMFNMFIKNNIHQINFWWINQLCRAKIIRVIMSHLSNDNQKNFKEKEIIILVYFITVLKNQINLKIAKCEIENEIIIVLRNLRFIIIISLNLTNNKQKNVLYRYFVILEIREINATLNTLIKLRD